MIKLKIALIHNSSPLEGGSFTYESNTSKYLKDSLPTNYILEDFYKGRKNGLFKKPSTYRVTQLQIFLAMVRQSALGFQILKILKMEKSRFEKFLISNGFDFVYFLSPNPSALTILNLPMLNTVWDLGHRHYPEFEEFSFEGRFQKREYFYNNVLKRSAHVVVDGEKTKAELVAFFGVQESRITSLGLFPVAIPHTCSESCMEEKFVFYPAQFWEHKNHNVLIEAFALIKPRIPNLKLVFSGADKGSKEKIQKLVNQHGLQETVLFVGFVSTQEMSMYYSHASLTAFPSMLGYTNLPPLESLLYGTPVIVSDVHEFDFELPPKDYIRVPTLKSALWAEAIIEKLEEGNENLELAEITSNILEHSLDGVDIKRLFDTRLLNI
jgi:glycosyltransferase involved in cell wall biosynthesis